VQAAEQDIVDTAVQAADLADTLKGDGLLPVRTSWRAGDGTTRMPEVD
jgi:hypothetical protein